MKYYRKDIHRSLPFSVVPSQKEYSAYNGYSSTLLSIPGDRPHYKAPFAHAPLRLSLSGPSPSFYWGRVQSRANKHPPWRARSTFAQYSWSVRRDESFTGHKITVTKLRLSLFKSMTGNEFCTRPDQLRLERMASNRTTDSGQFYVISCLEIAEFSSVAVAAIYLCISKCVCVVHAARVCKLFLESQTRQCWLIEIFPYEMEQTELNNKGPIRRRTIWDKITWGCFLSRVDVFKVFLNFKYAHKWKLE